MKPKTLEDEAKLLEKLYQLKGDVHMLENKTGLESVEAVDMDFGDFDFDDFDLGLEPVEEVAPAPAQPEPQPETPVNKPAKPKKKKKATPAKEVQPEEKPATPADVLSELDDLGEEETPTPAPAPVTPQLSVDQLAANGVAKLKDIETYLNARFIERDEVIKNVLRSLAIGTNMLLLGDPGTGKSDLIQTANSLIEGATYFSWLVNRTSDPAELVGPYSIKAMEQDKFIRKTEGKLPHAHVAFIDEIFKCNEPTLNMLLPLINEKIFYNGPTPTKVPLISMFAASNETPDDECLDALYDRILIRMEVEYIKDSKNRQRMYHLYATKGAGILEPAKITLDELLAIQEVANNLPFHKDVFPALDRLITTLKRNEIKISDRRQNNCLKIMRANAILEGRKQVTIQDLHALVYVLWEKKEDIELITDSIGKIIDPFTDKFNKFRESFLEQKERIERAQDDTEALQLAIEGRKALETLSKRISKIIKDAAAQGFDTTKFLETLQEVNNYQVQLSAKWLNIAPTVMAQAQAMNAMDNNL